MPNQPFLKRVRVQNYKSIGKCDVALGCLTVLVGRNGAGKSNFLDALRFITDALMTSLDHAVKSRGGIDSVRRRSSGHPRNLSILIEIDLPEWQTARYEFEIGSRTKGGFSVKSERLYLFAVDAAGRRTRAHYAVKEGNVLAPDTEQMPPATADRLYLVNAAGLPQFRGVYDALTAMGFYNLNPEEMKKPQSPDAGDLLLRDGSNIASVISRLAEDKPNFKSRIVEYLRAIVPDIADFERIALGNHETLEFRQNVQGAQHPWRFYASSMSDGTLRALGMLVAVMQLANRKNPVRLVGIEEPEIALHPAATGALMDSLREGAEHTQIIVTTHSPDLLDEFDADTDTLLVVQSDRGTTEIGPADPSSMEAIRDHLYTAGELLRIDQLRADRSKLVQQKDFAFDSVED